MFSREESRRMKQDFWTSFGKSFPTKWILYDTKIKGLAFKFHFDNKIALVTLDIEDDLEQRIVNWEKLESLKAILLNDYLPEAIYDETFFLENGKEISRVFVQLDQKVSIHNKDTWRDVMVFFNTNMALFEDFFENYKDFFEVE